MDLASQRFPPAHFKKGSVISAQQPALGEHTVGHTTPGAAHSTIGYLARPTRIESFGLEEQDRPMRPTDVVTVEGEPDPGAGGYDIGYRTTPCLWGTEPGSLVRKVGSGYSSFAGTRVLDLGCGEGKNSAYFATRGASVTALDISEAAIENARRAWSGPEFADVKFLIGDARRRDFAVEGFDVVVLYGLLHCLGDEPAMRSVAMAARAATTPGGINIVCALNNRLDGFTEGHIGFRPYRASHEFYVSLYRGWELSMLSDTDLTESHPPNHVTHTHSVTRFVARRPLAHVG